MRGLRARGGFEVTLRWEKGRLVEATLLSALGNPCVLRYGEKVVTLKTEAGKRYRITDGLEIRLIES